MLRKKSLLAVALLLATVGCGGGGEGTEGKKAKSVVDKSGHSSTSGVAVDRQAAEGFDVALKSFLDADAKGQWSSETCKEVAASFEAASKKQESASNIKLAEAEYNAGLAYARCGKESKAREHFEKSVGADSKFTEPRHSWRCSSISAVKTSRVPLVSSRNYPRFPIPKYRGARCFGGAPDGARQRRFEQRRQG